MYMCLTTQNYKFKSNQHNIWQHSSVWPNLYDATISLKLIYFYSAMEHLKATQYQAMSTLS